MEGTIGRKAPCGLIKGETWDSSRHFPHPAPHSSLFRIPSRAFFSISISAPESPLPAASHSPERSVPCPACRPPKPSIQRPARPKPPRLRKTCSNCWKTREKFFQSLENPSVFFQSLENPPSADEPADCAKPGGNSIQRSACNSVSSAFRTSRISRKAGRGPKIMFCMCA